MGTNPLVGTVIAGRYRLTELIRRGITGDTYLATHPVLGVRFAVKLLGDALSDDPSAKKRIRHEAEVVSRLDHPNIVSVHDFGDTSEGRFFLVMEHIQGHSLRREIRRIDPELMGLRRALVLLKQVCNALTTAHDAGVIHRGIRPANIYLTRSRSGDEQVKLLDFGLSKVVRDDATSSLTRNRPILGDPRYMAPEHLTGAPVDSRVDVYSVGVVAYKLLTGDLPFPGRKPIQIIAAHQMGPAPDLADMRPADLTAVPSNLERIIMRCLAVNREDRPRHVADLVEAILMTLPRVPDDRSEGKRHTITRVSGSADEAAAWGRGERLAEPPAPPAPPPLPPPAPPPLPPPAAPPPMPSDAVRAGRPRRGAQAKATTRMPRPGVMVDAPASADEDEEGFASSGETISGQSLDDLREQIWTSINKKAVEVVELLEQHDSSSEELSGYLKAIRDLEELEMATETEIAVLKDRIDETDARWRQETSALRDALLNLRQARGRLSEGDEASKPIVETLDAQIVQLETKLQEHTADLEETQQKTAAYLESRQQELENQQRKLGENQLILLQLLRFMKQDGFPAPVLEGYAALEELLAAVNPDRPNE